MKGKVWQELKNMTVIELETKLTESEEEMFRLKFRHSSTPLKNPLVIRNLRRKIAKIKTLLAQKAAEDKKKK